MNISELSDLSTVINQLKTVINTAGYSRFTKEKSQILKRRVMELEERFVQGIIDLPELLTAKDILKRTQQAKAELGLVQSDNSVEKALPHAILSEDGAIFMNHPQPVAEPLTETAKPEVLMDDGLVTIVPGTDVEEIQIREQVNLRLAEEKKKLAVKGKRKAV